MFLDGWGQYEDQNSPVVGGNYGAGISNEHESSGLALVASALSSRSHANRAFVDVVAPSGCQGDFILQCKLSTWLREKIIANYSSKTFPPLAKTMIAVEIPKLDPNQPNPSRWKKYRNAALALAVCAKGKPQDIIQS